MCGAQSEVFHARYCVPWGVVHWLERAMPCTKTEPDSPGLSYCRHYVRGMDAIAFAIDSVSVLIGKVTAQVELELAVVGMDGGAEGGFGRASLADAIENALHIAKSVRIADIAHCRQTFGIRDVGSASRKTHETAFQDVQGDVLLSLKKTGKLVPVTGETSRLQELCDALVKPGRTAAWGELGDERVRQFVLENVGQFRCDRGQTADGDAKLAIIERTHPTGGVGNVKKLR